jgi:O-antigen/teichoic acid export membrane protein
MIRERSLRANSVSSLIATGGVFAVTLAVPAVLARAVTQADYTTYATALAFLPLALLASQSLRNSAGSALIVAMRHSDGGEVAHAYRRIVLLIVAMVLLGGTVAIEFLRHFSSAGAELNDGLLRFGAYCVLVNVSGIALGLLVTGPATAQQDFIPENLLKIVPPMLQLALFFLIWIRNPPHELWWIFVAVAASPWPLTAWLLARYRGANHQWFESNRFAREEAGGAFRFLGSSSLSVGWWNLTAYFATSATVAIVALTLPGAVVAFGMAFSLMGVLSGGLIAISTPIASRAAAIAFDDTHARVAAFRRFNSLFIAYILIMAVAVLIVPSQIYELWVGPQYADQVRSMLISLIPATVLRLQTMCFTVFVMSVGRQSTLWLSPLVEAIVATVGSLLLVKMFGIEGIALALALSAAIRLAMTLAYDIRRNRDLFPIHWKDMMIPYLARI